MTDDKYRDMVIDHDKNIETLAMTVKTLATGVHETNGKLNDVIDVITQQNVLVERVNNMDTNVTDSFIRANKRIEKLEETTEGVGCTTARDCATSCSLLETRVKAIEDNALSTTEKIGSFVAGGTIRWAIGIILVYSIMFGSFVVDSIYSNRTEIRTQAATVNTHVEDIFAKIEKINTKVAENGTNN